MPRCWSAARKRSSTDCGISAYTPSAAGKCRICADGNLETATSRDDRLVSASCSENSGKPRDKLIASSLFLCPRVHRDHAKRQGKLHRLQKTMVCATLARRGHLQFALTHEFVALEGCC